jgi:hypothetical protein
MIRVSVIACVSVVLLVSSALAAPAGAGLGLDVGTRIDMVPASSFKASAGGNSQSYDGEFGAGFGLVSNYRILEYLKAGVELMYYTLKDEDAKDRTGLFGLGSRITGLVPFEQVGPLDAVKPYGFITLGYNHYSPGTEGSDSRNGFWFQAGAGAEVMFGRFSAFLELAYEGSSLEEKQQTEVSYSAFGMGVGAKVYF